MLEALEALSKPCRRLVEFFHARNIGISPLFTTYFLFFFLVFLPPITPTLPVWDAGTWMHSVVIRPWFEALVMPSHHQPAVRQRLSPRRPP